MTRRGVSNYQMQEREFKIIIPINAPPGFKSHMYKVMELLSHLSASKHV